MACPRSSKEIACLQSEKGTREKFKKVKDYLRSINKRGGGATRKASAAAVWTILIFSGGCVLDLCYCAFSGVLFGVVTNALRVFIIPGWESWMICLGDHRVANFGISPHVM
jgi:hypothetical protein